MIRGIFRSKRVCLLLLVLCQIIVALTWTFFKPTSRTAPRLLVSAPPTWPSGDPDVIRIISWTDKSAVRKGPWFNGHTAFSQCAPRLPEGRATCEYVHGRHLYNSSDVVLFKGTRMRADDMPRFRPANQRWVFYEMESPINTRRYVDFKTFRQFNTRTMFNYSVTFSDDADLHQPYGECEKLQQPSHKKRKQMQTKKTRLIAWFVSRCKSQSERESYVKKLQKHIKVDVFGRCGPLNCSRAVQDQCDQMLKKKYKFYLAFENSLCDDYVTEKFWKALELNVVPVVYGEGNYGQVAPPSSFINIRDFGKPEDLARYLLGLDKNDTLYNEYFHWKNKYRCGTQNRKRFPCDLCRFLHQVKGQGHRQYDVTKSWHEKKRCLSPDTFWENGK